MEPRTPHCVYAALTERFELRLSELNPQVGKVTYQLADLYSWLDHMVGFCINFVMLQAMCHCYRSAVAWGGMCSCSVQRSDAKAKQLCNVRAPKSWPVCAGPGFPAGEPAGGRHIRAARPQLDQGADRVSAAERGRPMRAGAARRNQTNPDQLPMPNGSCRHAACAPLQWISADVRVLCTGCRWMSPNPAGSPFLSSATACEHTFLPLCSIANQELEQRYSPCFQVW